MKWEKWDVPKLPVVPTFSWLVVGRSFECVDVFCGCFDGKRNVELRIEMIRRRDKRLR